MITIVNENNENLLNNNANNHRRGKLNGSGRLYTPNGTKTRHVSNDNHQQAPIRPIILSKQQNLVLKKDDHSKGEETKVVVAVTGVKDEAPTQRQVTHKNLKELSSNSLLSGGNSTSSSNILVQQNINLPSHEKSLPQAIQPLSISQRLSVAPQLTSSVRIIDENFMWNDQFQDYLSEQTDFLVVGILGKQGVGKSTLMSLLAGNKFTDETKNMIFKTGSKVNHYNQQTQDKSTIPALSAYITTERTILLDVQPMLSSSILDKAIKQEKKHVSHDFKYYENLIELQSIELACFLMCVCNVIIICEDWFTDLNIYKILQTAEMLIPNQTQDDFLASDQYPHLIFAQNKCDFVSMHELDDMRRTIDKFMFNSKVNYKGSIKDLKGKINKDTINLVTIPKYNDRKEFSGMVSFDRSIGHLKREILAVKRNSFANNQNFNEKKWFAHAAKMWETLKKSSIMSEYNRLMT